MLLLQFRFPAGRYHATPWGRNVNEGEVEWPPSPFRLARSLVDVCKRRHPDIDDDRLEALLEPLAKPPRFFLPPACASHTRSYLNSNKEDPTSKQKIFDAFVAVGKDDSLFMGFDVEPDEAIWETLNELLTDMNYLGRSESWVTVQVVDDKTTQAFNCLPLAEGADLHGKDVVKVACLETAIRPSRGGPLCPRCVGSFRSWSFRAGSGRTMSEADSILLLEDQPFVPARILNEFVYCPRLAYLEWVECEFTDNVYTVEGSHVHRRVDEKEEVLPAPSKQTKTGTTRKGRKKAEPEADDENEENDDKTERETLHARSVMLSADTLGLVARIDLVEAKGDVVTPVEYKRGSPPDNAFGVYDPERVQLCAQGMILQENGFRCESGVVYFAQTKQRVSVPFDDALVAMTKQAVLDLRALVDGGTRPPPLADSPKCNGCSLVGICLPDETRWLQDIEHPEPLPLDGLRQLYPKRDDALPLYVQQHGLYVGKRDDELVVKDKGTVMNSCRLPGTSQVCLFGNVGISAPALHACCQEGVPVVHFSYGGWFYGLTQGMGLRDQRG